MAKLDKTVKLYEQIMGDVRKVTEFEIRWLIKGWTYEELKAQIEHAMTEGGGIDRSTLFRWRTHRCAPQAVFRDALLEVMDAKSIAELGLGAAEDAARNFTYMNAAERKDEVHRRHTLKALGGAAVGLLLPASPLVATAQLLDRRKSIGRDEVTAAQHTATTLAIAYRENPGEDSVRAAKAHAYTLVDHLKSGRVRSAAEAGVQAVASDAAALAGYADLNAGRLDDAGRWFTAALSLAREAGDRRLEALALASRGLLHCDVYGTTPDPAKAVAASRDGAELHRFLPPSARAWVFGELALNTAATGDDLASGRFLARACGAAACLGYEKAGWGWWSAHVRWHGGSPDAYTAVRSLRLGRPSHALDGFAGLEGRSKPSPRMLAVRRLYVMQACAALGDLDQACGAAHTALDLASAYELGRIFLRVRTARPTFPKAGASTRLVRELDERLRLVA